MTKGIVKEVSSVFAPVHPPCTTLVFFLQGRKAAWPFQYNCHRPHLFIHVLTTKLDLNKEIIQTKMDRISKSLDQIISEGEHNRKGKGNRSNSAVNHKGGPKNHNSRNDKRDSTFNNKRGLKSEMEDWRVSAHREVEAADKAFRPMKVVTIERPKIVPAPVATVFNRLGSAGFAVVFQNLKNTVIESDVRELCESIGQVLSTSFQGHGQAKATFARQEDATECVSRFNGKYCNSGKS